MRSTGSARGTGGPASFALGLTRLGRARPPWISLSVGRGSSGRRAGASPTFSTDWFTTSLTFIPLAPGAFLVGGGAFGASRPGSDGRAGAGGRRHRLPLPHEAEELDALAQAPAQHGRVAEHAADHRHDLPRPAVEAAVAPL